MQVLKWRTQVRRIAQTVRNGLQYAFLSENDCQCAPFVYCKEFLIDCVWSCINEKRTFLYGFCYDPMIDPVVCLKRSRLLLRNMDDHNFSCRVPNCIRFINSLEQVFQFTKSELSRFQLVDNPQLSPVFLVEGSQKWLHAPPLLSLYALMIRVGMGYGGTGGALKYLRDLSNGKCFSYLAKDGAYVGQCLTTIKNLAGTQASRFCPDIRDNYPGYVDVLEHHEDGGIVSLSIGKAKKFFPFWYQPMLNGQSPLPQGEGLVSKGFR